MTRRDFTNYDGREWTKQEIIDFGRVIDAEYEPELLRLGHPLGAWEMYCLTEYLKEKRKMKLSDTIGEGGKFLRASDLPDRGEIQVKISGLSFETLRDGEQEELCLSFEGKEKMLVLNKTNKERLRAAFGDRELEKYVGESILLFTELVDFRGEMVRGIRVRPLPDPDAEDVPF